MQTKVVPMNYLKCFWVSSILWLFCAAVALADTRFEVKGDTIFFNTEINEDDESINYYDGEELRGLLKNENGIKRITLTSSGGSGEAGYAMARIVEDYNLETVAIGKCSSACVTVFLAGKNRILELGSTIGFHGSYWSVETLKNYYEDHKSSYGWTDELAFAAWVYVESQRDLSRKLKYFTQKGISLDFVIKASSLEPDQYWYPSREELIKAKFITN